MKQITCLSTVLILFITACGGPPSEKRQNNEQYQNRPVLEKSLFTSDQAVMSDDAIKRILSSKVVLPKKAKIALMKFPDNKWQYYSRSEEYLKLQQSYCDTITSKLLRAGTVEEVAVLPSMMIPKDISLSLLREAAVRLQADLLVVYKLESETYQDYSLFNANKAKAFSTCEVIFLDNRTGIIPFSAIATDEFLTEKYDSDSEFSVTIARAERMAAFKTLEKISEQMAVYLNNLPR